ncbi:MAG: hypothetical protein Fur009_3760 [Candidatus Microgenomates bacterium]
MKQNFTLVETIVVLGVLGLIIPTIFIIVFTISREQIKTNSLSIVKRQGDYIIENISNLIKNNAVSIHNQFPPDETNIVCFNSGNYSSNTDLVFEDKEGNWFRINYDGNKISSQSSTLTVDLNSEVTKINNFSISCETGTFYSPPSVALSFDICYKGSSSDCVLNNIEESVNLHYQTKIKLRNY